MSYGSYSAQYLEADVLSRPVEWLVPLLYEHLVSSLSRARVQIEKGAFEGKTASLDKASRIVFELLSSLDRERGGDLAGRLSALYTFLATEILATGRSMDVGHLQRLIDIASELHEAWVAAAEQVAPRGRSYSSMALQSA
jgi:flagellar secretion chaperone FliS